ncbi:MAG: hypothetical protein VX737_02105 [Pseudomonadota bacterium]|nr:hypothetical protein [Pseudomonadota bacterium]
MVKKHSSFFKKMSKDSTIRLYFAIIWRYVVWLILLNFIGFIFFNLASVMFFKFFLKHIDSLAMTIFFIRHFLFHIAAFMLSMESVLKVGFKSGHYKLVIENCRSKKKK